MLFYAEGCLPISTTKGYSYNFCYLGQSEGYYSNVTNAEPGFTDLFLKDPSSGGSLKNTTPNRKAPLLPMRLTFKALHTKESPVCTASAPDRWGTEKPIAAPVLAADKATGYCMVDWAAPSVNPSQEEFAVDGVLKFSRGEYEAIEGVSESSAPQLIAALNAPARLMMFVVKPDSFSLPGECQVSGEGQTVSIPVDGREPIC